jgi:hypothetical protein
MIAGHKAVLRIWDVYPRSAFFHPGSRIKKIPDPGSASKNLIILTQKLYALGNMIEDVYPGSRSQILIFYPSRGQKGTGSLIRNTDTKLPSKSDF